jgi:O-methyltransferase
MKNYYFNYKVQLMNILFKKIFRFNLTEDSTIPDGLITYHNKSFFYDFKFRSAYAFACKFTGHDFKIPYRIHQAIWAVHTTKSISGDIVELGTGKGFTFSSILKYFEADKEFNSKQIFLYDLFQQPEEVGVSFKNYGKFYSSSPDISLEKFKEFNNVKLVVGNLYETLHLDSHQLISFLHIDLNFADIEIHCINILYGKLNKGGIILLDDFANAGHEEQYSKWIKFALVNNIYILNTPSGQGIIVKN